MEPAHKAVHALVHGRVQGVGSRYSALREARLLLVRGMVRNCEDGSVEVIAEGEAERVDRFVDWLREGPPGAYVRSVDVDPLPYSGSYRGFDVEF